CERGGQRKRTPKADAAPPRGKDGVRAARVASGLAAGLLARAVDIRPMLEVQRLPPVLRLPVGFLAGDAVALLHLADELVLLAADDVQIVVGELAPLLLGLALQLIPH